MCATPIDVHLIYDEQRLRTCVTCDEHSALSSGIAEFQNPPTNPLDSGSLNRGCCCIVLCLCRLDWLDDGRTETSTYPKYDMLVDRPVGIGAYACTVSRGSGAQGGDDCLGEVRGRFRRPLDGISMRNNECFHSRFGRIHGGRYRDVWSSGSVSEMP